MTSTAVDNDELSAFVASTLKAIATGVEAAADQTSVQSGGWVHSFTMPEKISFDVAVSAKRNETKGAGLKVQIASIIGGEGNLSKAEAAEEITRIAFEVRWTPVESVEHSRSRYSDRYEELNEDD